MNVKKELKQFKELAYFKDIMKINWIFFLFFMLSDSLDVFFPLYIKEHQVPAVYYGLLETGVDIVRMGLIWLMAKPTMKSKKRILVFIMATNVVNFCLVSMDNVPFVFYIFVAFAASRTILNMTLNPYLARLLPNEFMGIGFGIRDVFLSLGCACGLFISGFLSNSILVFSIYLAVVAGLLLIIILRTKMREIKEIEEDEENEEEENLANFKNMPTRLKVNFVLLVFIGMFILFGLTVLDYQTMIGDDIGIEVQSIYNLYSSSVIITAIFSIIGGVIIDRFESKKLYLAYTATCFVSCFILIFQNIYVYASSLFLLGLKGVLDNVEQTYFFKVYKNYDMEKLYSVNTILQMVLSFIAPILFGWLYDWNYEYMIIIGSGFLVIAMVLCLGILEEEKAE